MSTPSLSDGTQASDDLLAALADDFLRRNRAGESPQVEEYVSKYPELADRIRDVFPAILVMEQPDARATLDLERDMERVGATIGRYKLLQRIGEGGFGVVYMAEQQHPIRRKVALKVIKPGLDTRQVIARFEAERQALALMDHENIAKALDAGATHSGRPYFVMELVHGVPVTDFCDENQLSPRERLELFVQVCRAVQHAHTKGIIHRDVKPTNVLVTLHDGMPVPKVIDFGIAKATGQQLTEKTLFTHFAQMVGTPLYMSPEQAEMTGIDVDTRSDVYSLGVLLYELLTGTTPLDSERLKRSAFDEIRRIIREEEPPRPSTRLSTLGEQAKIISARRNSDPKTLGQFVKGELDWIVMKALEKDRSRRYETANGLARDIERYLRNETVEACPPSAAYRLRLFMRRNRPALTIASVVAASLVMATFVSLWQASQARRAESLAEARLAGEQEARRQAIAALIYVLGDKAKAEEWDDIVTEIAAIDPSRPKEVSAVARAMRSMAQQENSDGNHQQAERLARRSIALHRADAGDHHIDVAESLHALGFALWQQKKLDDADSAYQEALQIYREHYGDDTWLVLLASRGLLYVAQARGDERTVDEIRARAEQVLKHADLDIHALRQSTMLFVALEQWKQAEDCVARTIELDPMSVDPRAYLALLQLIQKNHEGYLATCQAILVQGEELADFKSRFVAAWTCLLAPKGGIELERINALLKSVQDQGSINESYKQAVAIALYRSGRYEEAEDRFRQLIQANGRSEEQQLHAAIARFFLAMTQQQQNRRNEAQSSLELANHEAEIVRQGQQANWHHRLSLKLWREEAQQLVLGDDWPRGDSSIAAEAPRPARRSATQ